jgi:hypothetical protein
MGVSVSGDRSVRPVHRRAGFPEADLVATRQFFIRALDHGPSPTEVSTDRPSTYPRVIEELIPAACHVTEHYGNNSVEADYGRLEARPRPMRGLKPLRSARVISAGTHAFVQNRRGHYDSAEILIDGIGSRRSSQNSPAPSERGSTAENHVCYPPTQLSIIEPSTALAAARWSRPPAHGHRRLRIPSHPRRSPRPALSPPGRR